MLYDHLDQYLEDIIIVKKEREGGDSEGDI